MEWELEVPLTPFFQRNQLCLGGGVVFCCQQLSSSQRWDSSSECSRKSRPHLQEPLPKGTLWGETEHF